LLPVTQKTGIQILAALRKTKSTSPTAAKPSREPSVIAAMETGTRLREKTTKSTGSLSLAWAYPQADFLQAPVIRLE
jgi:hypothetical protein